MQLQFFVVSSDFCHYVFLNRMWKNFQDKLTFWWKLEKMIYLLRSWNSIKSSKKFWKAWTREEPPMIDFNDLKWFNNNERIHTFSSAIDWLGTACTPYLKKPLEARLLKLSLFGSGCSWICVPLYTLSRGVSGKSHLQIEFSVPSVSSAFPSAFCHHEACSSWCSFLKGLCWSRP